MITLTNVEQSAYFFHCNDQKSFVEDLFIILHVTLIVLPHYLEKQAAIEISLLSRHFIYKDIVLAKIRRCDVTWHLTVLSCINYVQSVRLLHVSSMESLNVFSNQWLCQQLKAVLNSDLVCSMAISLIG